MNLKLLFLFTLFQLAFGIVSAQIKQVQSAKDATLEARKTLQVLILTLKKQDAELFTVFDSSNLKKIRTNYQPIFKKFYSSHLKEYKLTEDDYFIDTAFQSILLYNNAQYLHKLPSSLIHISNAEKKELELISKHPLLRYAKYGFIISLKKDNEEWPFYSVLLDEQKRLLWIAPIMNFDGKEPQPKINKILQSFSTWRQNSKTIYKLEQQRN